MLTTQSPVVRLSAAIAHHIPFVYIEQAIAERDITNAYNRFLEDFKPKTAKKVVPIEKNVIQKRLDDGLPVLTPFEQQLLAEHLAHSISVNKLRRLALIEKCLVQYIQSIVTTNYPSLAPLSRLDYAWLKTFLLWARPQLNPLHVSWLDFEQL